MVHPEGCGLLHQAMLDAILKHPNHLFYLPIGFAVTNGDVVVDDTQPFAELCQVACKLGANIYLDVLWLAPMGNQVIVQEFCSPPAM